MCQRTITKSYDNGVSTYYRVDLVCGHNQKINYTRLVGQTVTCIDCTNALIEQLSDPDLREWLQKSTLADDERRLIRLALSDREREYRDSNPNVGDV